jgi:hypothetical protein
MAKRNDPIFKKVLPVAAVASILAMVALLMGLALTRNTDDRAAAYYHKTVVSCNFCNSYSRRLKKSSNQVSCIPEETDENKCLLVYGSVKKLIGNSYSCSVCSRIEAMDEEVYCLDNETAGSGTDVCTLVSIDDAGLDVQSPDAAEPANSIQQSGDGAKNIMPPIPYEGYICKEDSSTTYSSKRCTYPGSQLTVMPPAKATKCTVIDPKYYSMNTRPMVPDGPVAYCCPSNTVYDSFKQQCTVPTTVPARTNSGPIKAPSPMPPTTLNVERAE